MPGLKLKTAATGEAISLEEMKAHCSVDLSSTTWDGLLGIYGAAATALAEKFTGQSICPQTWQLVLDDFEDQIELARAPVTQVGPVIYLDADGIEQTLSSSIYVVDIVSWPARIVLASDATWPEVADRINAVSVEFVTGYETVPADIKLALLTMVASWFENREVGAMPAEAARTLHRYRRIVI